MAECIGIHYAGMVNAVLGPISAALGIEYKPGKLSKGEKRATTLDRSDLDAVRRARERESRILMGASAIPGIKVEL